MNLFLLGSCRIHRPMRRLHSAGKVNLLNYVDPCWFTHTARAARQSLEIICGHKAPPLHLRELFFETDDDRQISFSAPEMVRNADMIMMEICTLKAIDIEGWDVNAHRVRKAKNNKDPRLAASVQRMDTAKEIAEEIDLIVRMSGKKVMVVNHISDTGQPDLDRVRKKLTSTLNDAKEIVPFTLFDTHTVLGDVPFDVALEDVNHYKTSFERSVGNAMYPVIEAVLSNA